jgi:hypothetical protein
MRQSHTAWFPITPHWSLSLSLSLSFLLISKNLAKARLDDERMFG